MTVGGNLDHSNYVSALGRKPPSLGLTGWISSRKAGSVICDQKARHESALPVDCTDCWYG